MLQNSGIYSVLKKKSLDLFLETEKQENEQLGGLVGLVHVLLNLG